MIHLLFRYSVPLSLSGSEIDVAPSPPFYHGFDLRVVDGSTIFGLGDLLGSQTRRTVGDGEPETSNDVAVV